MLVFFRSLASQPYLLLTLTALFWGGNAIAGRFANGHVSPMMLTGLRWTIALIIVGYLARKHLRRDWKTIRRNVPYLLAMGAIGYTIFNFFLYSALKYTTAINVTIEQSSMPLFIFLASFVLYRTRVAPLQIAGYAMTLIGVVLTATYGDVIGFFTGGAGLVFNRGDLLMLCGAVCYAGYSVALGKKPELHWLSFLACLITGAFLTAIPGALIEALAGVSLFPVTLQGWLVVIYAGIFPSILSQAFFIRGVEQLGANTAGLYMNLTPVFGALLAIAVLGEAFRWFHAVAFVLVVGGVLLAQRAGRSLPAAGTV